MVELRQKYHVNLNRDGSKSVALTPESYSLLKIRAEELDVTIKSLLAVLIESYIDKITIPKEN
jgi:hypothetical protein